MAILGVLASYTAHSPEKQLGPKVLKDGAQTFYERTRLFQP